MAIEETKHILGYLIEYIQTEFDVLKNVEALLIVTELIDFRVLNFDSIKID